MEGASSVDSADGRKRTLKLVAAVVVVILLTSVVFSAWYFFLRHWSIEELADGVVNDPTLDAPGFKHSLAGKSIVVEGEVTNITTRATSIGDLTFVEIDDYELLQLVVWGTPDFGIGDRIEEPVQFEWSTCNDERHVYSPQLSFPNFVTIPSMEVVMHAVNAVAGGVGLVTSQLENGDVRLDIDFVMDPIPLGDANCTLKTGARSFTGEYIDLMGEFEMRNVTDHISSLDRVHGELGIIQFTDADSDNYLDEDDYLILKNLTRPSTESGFKTYLFTIEWSPDLDRHWQERAHAVSYLPMTSKGLLRYDFSGTPYAHIARSSVPSGFEYTVTSVDYATDWGNVTALMHISSGLEYNTMEWSITKAELKGLPGTNLRFPAVTIGDYSVRLNVTDAQGDGRLDEDDRFSFTAEGVPFSNESDYSFELLFNPSYSSICRGSFEPNSAPVARLISETIPSGIRCTFSAPHTGFNTTYEAFDVPWRETEISLSDGNSTVSWTLGPGDLTAGTSETVSLPQATLGSLVVLCNATDIQGNGYLDGWDSITISTAGTDRFSSSVTYTIRITYMPKLSDMCSVTFTG